MQQSKIQFADPQRWLLGESPAWFLGEVVIRAILIYVMLLVILRLMGKRTAGQMSITELAVVVTLGAAVGVPMQDPNKGMLNGALILVVALIFQRSLSWSAAKSRKMELISQGDVSSLVEDGRLMLPQMMANGISRERLFSVLRGRAIEHLGQVRRVYIEPSGDFSIYEQSDVQPGLSVLPTFDDRFRGKQIRAAGTFACFSCGETRSCEDKPEDGCPRCGCEVWTEAVRRIQHVEAEQKQAAEKDRRRNGSEHEPAVAGR